MVFAALIGAAVVSCVLGEMALQAFIWLITNRGGE
jgi:hypothetical protein